MQIDLNKIIDIICNSKKFIQNVQAFCEDEFSFLIKDIESIQLRSKPKAMLVTYTKPQLITGPEFC